MLYHDELHHNKYCIYAVFQVLHKDLHKNSKGYAENLSFTNNGIYDILSKKMRLSLCIFVITLSATLFVTFVGSVFTMTLAHLFPAKSVTLISMVLLDIATNLDVGCTKINKTQKMTADENHRRFKFVLFEISS